MRYFLYLLLAGMMTVTACKKVPEAKLTDDHLTEEDIYACKAKEYPCADQSVHDAVNVHFEDVEVEGRRVYLPPVTCFDRMRDISPAEMLAEVEGSYELPDGATVHACGFESTPFHYVVIQGGGEVVHMATYSD